MIAQIHLPDAKPLAAIAILLGLLAWESAAPFFAFPKGSPRFRHGVKNVLLGTANGLMTSLVFVGVWWIAADWADRNGVGILHWSRLPAVAEFTLAVILLDAWTYAWHRMNHRVPFLWRFHRVHHSDPHMDVTTAHRFHIGEILFSSILRVPVIVAIGASLGQIAVYEVLMFAVVQFHHANISVTERWDRVLRWVIVTPFMHKVHHSRWQPETDSNYSSLLSVWDRLFRSFRHRERPEELRLGLEEFDSPGDQSLAGLVATPWRKGSPQEGNESRAGDPCDTP